jgi:hypothetical protein
MSTALSETASEKWAVIYRHCLHREAVSLEDYLERAFELPTYCHKEIELPETSEVRWELTCPNNDCTTCSAQAKEYWRLWVGEPPLRSEIVSRSQARKWQAYHQRLTLVRRMIESASDVLNRKVSLEDLLALVGQVCRLKRGVGNVTIITLLMPRETHVYGECDASDHISTEPVFELRDGDGQLYTSRLSGIRLADAST